MRDVWGSWVVICVCGMVIEIAIDGDCCEGVREVECEVDNNNDSFCSKDLFARTSLLNGEGES